MTKKKSNVSSLLATRRSPERAASPAGSISSNRERKRANESLDNLESPGKVARSDVPGSVCNRLASMEVRGGTVSEDALLDSSDDDVMDVNEQNEQLSNILEKNQELDEENSRIKAENLRLQQMVSLMDAPQAGPSRYRPLVQTQASQPGPSGYVPNRSTFSELNATNVSPPRAASSFLQSAAPGSLTTVNVVLHPIEYPEEVIPDDQLRKIEVILNNIVSKTQDNLTGTRIDAIKFGAVFIVCGSQFEADFLTALVNTINWARDGISPLRVSSP